MKPKTGGGGGAQKACWISILAIMNMHVAAADYTFVSCAHVLKE